MTHLQFQTVHMFIYGLHHQLMVNLGSFPPCQNLEWLSNVDPIFTPHWVLPPACFALIIQLRKLITLTLLFFILFVWPAVFCSFVKEVLHLTLPFFKVCCIICCVLFMLMFMKGVLWLAKGYIKTLLATSKECSRSCLDFGPVFFHLGQKTQNQATVVYPVPAGNPRAPPSDRLAPSRD